MEKASRERVAVYLHGSNAKSYKWYRIELPMPNPHHSKGKGKKRKRSCSKKKIQYPVAKMLEDDYGIGGSWDVIDDSIYWTGGWDDLGGRIEYFLYKGLLKHDTTKKIRRDHWETESCMNIPRETPFVAALKNHKLCVVSGDNPSSSERLVCKKPRLKTDDDDHKCIDRRYIYNHPMLHKCGQVYHLDKRCWTYLDANYSDVHRYEVIYQIAVVQNKGEEPTQIVFYDMKKGCTQFLDVPNGGTLTDPQYHYDFDLYEVTSECPIPKGLKHYTDVTTLTLVAMNVRAVFANGTFYWFTPDMRLYGYNVQDETWLRSPSLKHEFPKVRFHNHHPRYPILHYLPNGKFLVCVTIHQGQVIMAFLTVLRQRNSLTVSVDLVNRRFCFDDRSFEVYDGKAKLLKDTGAGSIQG